ncbi:hypothetical protein [Qipengyuania vesicularis]|uniref:hypothetical protein n=1 Tax=Qipengyuania vesicularis TaxID=2867232 RepID=UPI001C873013|nr:hypothetical protein [Qipengyuania vesicularis]MBX7526794.1 hypothetical protein [Qipengyuania vesicularis]
MDSLPVWALGGIGLLAYAALSFEPDQLNTVLVEASQSEALAALDGQSDDVFGTGLGGLRISGERLGADKVEVVIQRMNTDQEIICHVTVKPEAETHVSLETDCLAPVSDEAPDRRQVAALRIVTPVAREFAVSAIQERAYETSGVVDDMMTGIHDPEIGIRGDLGH